MKKEAECAVVRDLLPNHLENLTSPLTDAFVEQHLMECEECRKVKRAMQGVITPAEQAQSEMLEALKRARKREKRIVRTVVLAVIIALAVCLFPLPRDIDITIPCIQWRNGQAEAEMVNVVVRGTYKDYLIFSDSFSGDIIIENKAATQPPNRLGDIRFEGLNTILAYQDWEGMLHSRGEITVSPGMKEIMILWYEENGSWTSGDGQVIAGPAVTREEAVALTRELCENYNKFLANVRWEGGVTEPQR